MSSPDRSRSQKALKVKLSHPWSTATPLFDDEHLVSDAGLVPVMVLAEQAGLSELVAERVELGETRVVSAGVNPAGKLSSIIAGMAAGADSIDDLQVIRSGGMKRLFAEVYAPATLGQFLREFTHGHCLQLASVARAHLVNLATRTKGPRRINPEPSVGSAAVGPGGGEPLWFRGFRCSRRGCRCGFR